MGDARRGRGVVAPAVRPLSKQGLVKQAKGAPRSGGTWLARGRGFAQGEWKEKKEWRAVSLSVKGVHKEEAARNEGRP